MFRSLRVLADLAIKACNYFNTRDFLKFVISERDRYCNYACNVVDLGFIHADLVGEGLESQYSPSSLNDMYATVVVMIYHFSSMMHQSLQQCNRQ